MSDERKNGMSRTYQLTCWGLMAALAFVSNYVMFPLLGSRVTVSNSICVLCGMILGPWAGFVTAGLGAFLYDLIAGYGAEGMITLVSKGAIGLIAGLICHRQLTRKALDGSDRIRLFIGAGIAAVTYVVLYMLKTLIMGLTVNGLTWDATLVKMGTKLPASLLNAAFATVTAPILMQALHQPLHHLGVLKA